ncbi:hypothetical protein [Calidifontibacillus oryziterrae]|uniref:hypothetical protein n=1 Tax=Calidifontibacillus oryziterrae TaxID=1191699 RepID=UPI0002FFA5F8|nr:hypothetical protein [Calidifontibacillus oryziterrae]
MEQKAFDLLEKMYVEMQEIKSNMATKQDLAKVEDKVDKLEQTLILFENKTDANQKALFDGYTQTYEKLSTLEVKIERIEQKIEKQDVEIRVIKSAAK